MRHYEQAIAGLSKCDVFTWSLRHELGHYEAMLHRLNCKCELLAWHFAGELRTRLLGDKPLLFWDHARREALKTYKIEWDEELAQKWSESLCQHRRKRPVLDSLSGL
jgi:hypothetical protein